MLGTSQTVSTRRSWRRHCSQRAQSCSGTRVSISGFFSRIMTPPTRLLASIIKAWNSKHHGVKVSLLVGWPGNSPDLNPIENLWAWAQAEVDAMGCKTCQEFKKCVSSTLKNVPKKLLGSLVGSMGKRVRACIENEGYKTKY